jgi:hypothetical protein
MHIGRITDLAGFAVADDIDANGDLARDESATACFTCASNVA